MKKIILIMLTVMMLFSSAAFAQGWNSDRRQERRNFHPNRPCESWTVIDRNYVARGIRHDFVDRNCDGLVDIVQEYRWNGRHWVTTRWWIY